MKAASDLKMIGFGMMVGTLPGAGFLGGGGGARGVLADGRAVKYINYIRAAAWRRRLMAFGQRKNMIQRRDDINAP